MSCVVPTEKDANELRGAGEGQDADEWREYGVRPRKPMPPCNVKPKTLMPPCVVSPRTLMLPRNVVLVSLVALCVDFAMWSWSAAACSIAH